MSDSSGDKPQCACADRERHDWFKMSPGAFFASDTVNDCDPWEIQCFLHMLMMSWQGPGLPADTHRLAKRLGLTVERAEELMAGAVGDKWEQCCGKLWNPNQEELRIEAQARRESYQARGKKGGKASGKVRKVEATAKLQRSTSLDTAKLQPSNSEAAAKLSEAEEKRREETRGEESSTQTRASALSPSAPVEPKVQRGKLVPAQLQMLAQELSLRDDAIEAFEAWRVYRIEIGKQLTQSSARKLAKRAAEHPEEFIRDVEHSIEQGYQGIFAPKDAGQAVAANGQSMRGMSFRTQDEALKAHRNAEIEDWIREGEEGAA